MIMKYCKFYNKIKGNKKRLPCENLYLFQTDRRKEQKTENVKIYLLASKNPKHRKVLS